MGYPLWDSHAISYITYHAAHKGLAGFTRVTKFDIEDFCIDIYCYFDKSRKRKNALQSYAEFCDHENRDILKRVNVRWLSFERVIERILLQYASLKGYLQSEDAPNSTTNDNGAKSEWGITNRFKRFRFSRD